jgi:hypothetical protein
MTLSKVHARIQEDKKKLNPVDGRRFNSRSREKMEREIRVIRKSAKKLIRKNTATKHLYRGIFSAEEVAFANEEKQKFREACSKRMSEKVVPASPATLCGS